jgi:hypothetical protein
MESESLKNGFRAYSRGVMNAVGERLRDRVPYEESGKHTDVVGLLHRLTTVDFVTHNRFKGLARTVMELSEGNLTYGGALEILAHALGHTSYKSAWKAKVDGSFINARKERKKKRKEAEVVCG